MSKKTVPNKPVKRPWGHYTVIFRGKSFDNDCVVKHIVVNPGEEISLQYHTKRKEIWTMLTMGYLRLGDDNKLYKVHPGNVIHIKPLDVHQIKADLLCSTEFIEVQYGICSEEDIVRIEDKYGR